ncbi:MAG: rubredoxin [Clostridia bacterium]
MAKFVCSICGYVHDETTGEKWDELDENWVCPLCKAAKTAFKQEGATQESNEAVATLEIDEDMRELSVLEMSILCSNLARGCEKQYQTQEAEMFAELAAYFKKAAPVEDDNYQAISLLINEDLQKNIVIANQIANKNEDRGAKRALVWVEKVSLILQSILNRYEKEGDSMLENTGVYVCSICGFIYIGNELPELCPVCKVPNWKFEKIEGGE